MPAFEEDPSAMTLPFPPLKKSHIINCSYPSWYKLYRPLTPKARLIPLSQPFLDYLRADGIVLPPDPRDINTDADDEWAESDTEDAASDPSTAWPEIHAKVTNAIAALDGRVAPKLNWSAPKDATFMNPTNSQDCRAPNDVYLLLKSSSFVTHDLEHAFDGCDPTEQTPEIPYTLVLRKFFNMNPSVEFRCFVRRRTLLGITQRDLNHYDFLFELQPTLLSLIRSFFDKELKSTFPDEDFVFDVYVPNPYTRVWLVDTNPWAPRTDPLLFSWLELLTMPDPDAEDAVIDLGELQLGDEEVVRIPFRPAGSTSAVPFDTGSDDEAGDDDETDPPALDVDPERPLELRLIKKSDPEGYTFNTPQYSAHKLPRDVVDASQSSGSALHDFAAQWRAALEKRQAGEDESSSDDD